MPSRPFRGRLKLKHKRPRTKIYRYVQQEERTIPVMGSSIEEFVKSEDIDVNEDKPTSGGSNQVIEQFCAELRKKAYYRVVKEIVDKRERIAKKKLKDEAKTKEELSKRQPEQLLEQYVSSCVKQIVTTSSPTQGKVKAEGVVSALKNVPKGNRKNFQTGGSKSRQLSGGAQERGK